ncbi:MAG: transporter substrate-binding domain-containing protein [Oscillospiraceae bacterium]
MQTGEQPGISSLPHITIGSDTYPPFVYLDNNGDPTGIDVEIAVEAFRRMGYQAVFTTIDWEQKRTRSWTMGRSTVFGAASPWMGVSRITNGSALHGQPADHRRQCKKRYLRHG